MELRFLSEEFIKQPYNESSEYNWFESVSKYRQKYHNTTKTSFKKCTHL